MTDILSKKISTGTYLSSGNDIKSSKISKYLALTTMLILFSLLCVSAIDTCQAADVIDTSTDPLTDDTTTETETTDTNSTNNTTNTTITLNKTEIAAAATQVANYIDKKKKLPNNVTTGNKVLTIPQYLYAVTSLISGKDNVTLFNITEKFYLVSRKSTSYTASEYKSLALRTRNYLYNYKKTLPYISSPHGNVDYYNMIYMFSRVGRFYDSYHRMPSYVTLKTPLPYTARKLNSAKLDRKISYTKSQMRILIKRMNSIYYQIKRTQSSWKIKKLRIQYYQLKAKYTTQLSRLRYYQSKTKSEWYIPAKLRKYLKTTSYCQVTDPSIVYMAMMLSTDKQYTSGKNIYDWVRDNLDYSFYYRTKYGAAKALKYRKGNCVDQAHLIVATARSAGLPARYVRGYCKFISGNYYSHVWAQIWIKGKGWVTADPTHSINSFGVARNWYPSKSKIHGTLVQYSL